jgi:hypothetical protein
MRPFNISKPELGRLLALLGTFYLSQVVVEAEAAEMVSVAEAAVVVTFTPQITMRLTV